MQPDTFPKPMSLWKKDITTLAAVVLYIVLALAAVRVWNLLSDETNASESKSCAHSRQMSHEVQR
jgi:predicted negative regulator of RcsB-dependent stress response